MKTFPDWAANWIIESPIRQPTMKSSPPPPHTALQDKKDKTSKKLVAINNKQYYAYIKIFC